MPVLDGRLADSMPIEPDVEQLSQEKAALQSQNAQLWRLVDKQRAMILGLQKDIDQLKQNAKISLPTDSGSAVVTGKASEPHVPYPTTPKRGTAKENMPMAPDIIEDYDDVSTTTDQSPTSIASPASQVATSRRPPIPLDLKSVRSVMEDSVPSKSPLRSATNLRPSEVVRDKSARLDGSYTPMSPALTARMQQVSRSVSPRLPPQSVHTGYDEIERVSVPRRERVRKTASSENTIASPKEPISTENEKHSEVSAQLATPTASESISSNFRKLSSTELVTDEPDRAGATSREAPIRTHTPDAIISDARVVQLDKGEAQLRQMTASESGATLADIAAPYYHQSSSFLPLSQETVTTSVETVSATPKAERHKQQVAPSSPGSDYESSQMYQVSPNEKISSAPGLEPSAEFFPSPERTTWQEHSPERPRFASNASHMDCPAPLREADAIWDDAADLPLTFDPSQLKSLMVHVIDQPDADSVSLGLFNAEMMLVQKLEKPYEDLVRLEHSLAVDVGIHLPSQEEFHSAKQTQLSSNRARIDIWFDSVHNLLSEATHSKKSAILASFYSAQIRDERTDRSREIHQNPISTVTSQASNATIVSGPRHTGDHVDFASRSIFKEGFLSKRGKNFGGYKERYFVLENDSLQFFDAPGGSILGSIKLEHSQIIGHRPTREHASTDSDGFHHAFLILEPKRKTGNSVVRHILCAKSDSERDEWVKALLSVTQAAMSQHTASNRESDGMPGKTPREGDQEHRSSARLPSDTQSTISSGPYTPSQPRRQKADRDDFSAIGYNETIPGRQPLFEARHQTQGYSKAEHLDYDAIPPVISGPLNGKPIDNNTAWGATTMSTNLAVPVTTQPTIDKKMKKKSFWNFGKSDQHNQSNAGRDTASVRSPSYNELSFGTSTGHSQIFGAPLAEAAAATTNRGLSPAVPLVVLRCVQYLTDKHAEAEEGIYRLSGSNIVIRGLRERFSSEIDIDLVGCGEYFDIHAVAGLLKLYLRELPSSILTRDLQRDFLDIIEMPGDDARTITLRTLTQSLPRENFELLKFLSSHLRTIVDHSIANKMTLRNVGIVFSPTLNIPASVFAVFIEEYYQIFGSRGPNSPPEDVSEAQKNAFQASVPPKNPAAPSMLDSTQSYNLLQHDYSQELQEYAHYNDLELSTHSRDN